MREISAWTLGSIGGFSNASSKLLARALRSQPADRSSPTTVWVSTYSLADLSPDDHPGTRKADGKCNSSNQGRIAVDATL